MGMDKEATDIWVFGKPRPDLTVQQTMIAAKDSARDLDLLPTEERMRRGDLIKERFNAKLPDMLAGINEALARDPAARDVSISAPMKG